MSHFIQSRQVREGDVLILRRERQITVPHDADEDGDFQDEHFFWVLKGEYDTIELVSRAEKPLPEEIGTFIRQTDNNGNVADTSWVVGAGGKLLCQDGRILYREEFLNHLADNDFSFDVIS